jgi:hypothetical protein
MLVDAKYESYGSDLVRVGAASFFVDMNPRYIIDGWRKEQFPRRKRTPFSLILSNTACKWHL